jgi:N-acetylglutamate synthase-like GNAT family acetyltransferase
MNISGNSQDRLPANVAIRNKLVPGDIGYLIYLHGILYANEYGWDYTFEAYVAGPLAEFAKSYSDRDRIWIIEKDGKVSGSVAIVAASQKTAQLRWLLLHPDLRGLGIGKILMEETLGFCQGCFYSSVFLLTVSALKAATNLYRSFGFQLIEENDHAIWGTVVTQQKYELKL